MTKSNAAATPVPSAQEVFERLSNLTEEMRETSASVESIVAKLPTSEAGNEDIPALQNLDRMTQNLTQISKLLHRLSQAENGLQRHILAQAIHEITLPSLKSYLEHGVAQTDQGEVDLF